MQQLYSVLLSVRRCVMSEQERNFTGVALLSLTLWKKNKWENGNMKYYFIFVPGASRSCQCFVCFLGFVVVFAPFPVLFLASRALPQFAFPPHLHCIFFINLDLFQVIPSVSTPSLFPCSSTVSPHLCFFFFFFFLPHSTCTSSPHWFSLYFSPVFSSVFAESSVLFPWSCWASLIFVLPVCPNQTLSMALPTCSLVYFFFVNLLRSSVTQSCE